MQYLTAAQLQTPLGQIFTVTDSFFLFFLKFIEQEKIEKQIMQLEKQHKFTIKFSNNNILQQLQKEITAYFQKKLQAFNTPIKLVERKFQQVFWQTLATIPYECITSFVNQAAYIKASQNFHAVALTNKANPLVIIYLCHRVIKHNREVNGYNGGIDKKIALLNLEKKYVTT